MNSQFKRGIIELCVLKELIPKDLYGYEIINNLSEHLNVNDNTIYPILRRLTKEGYFTTYLKESTKGAPRKYYKITKSGFQYYLSIRDEWDEFIGGVYAILNKGGKKNEEIYQRFRNRVEEK